MATADGKQKKTYFVPLENNPEVMNKLVHELGLSEQLAWHDVYSLDDPTLLEFVPRPSHALLLVFPVSKAYEKSRFDEDSQLQDYSGSGADQEVLWFKQTIGNACGLIGLLHAATNGSARGFITATSPLDHLISQAVPLRPSERAQLLETSPQLASAHASAASHGDTAAPAAEDRVDLHYVAFVKTAQNNLWELDGSRKGPINRGALLPSEDVLSARGLEMGPKKFFEREAAAGGADLRFSVLALGPNVD